MRSTYNPSEMFNCGNDLLKQALTEEKFSIYQQMPYEDQIAVVEKLITGRHCVIKVKGSWNPETYEHNMLDRTYSDVTALLDGIACPNISLQQFANEKFQPNLVNLSTLRTAVEIARDEQQHLASASPSKSGVTLSVLGPEVDAYVSARLRCMENAVEQAASQTNSLEFRSANPNYPAEYSRDRTQGPAVQKQCALFAFLYYHYWQLNNQPEVFLTEWQSKPGFSDIFETRYGYMHPKEGQEAAALAFIEKYADSLLIPVHNVKDTASGNPITHVLCAALAFGDYDNKTFNYNVDPYDRTRLKNHFSLIDGAAANSLTEEQQELMNALGGLDVLSRARVASAFLSKASEAFLKIQYEKTALVAIEQALRNPEKRVPLIFTVLGGGVFENDPKAIEAAIRHALETVVKSGVQNIDFAMMAYAEEESEKAKILFEKFATEFALQSPVVQLNNADLMTPASLTEAREQKLQKIALLAPLQEEEVRRAEIEQEEIALRRLLVAANPAGLFASSTAANASLSSDVVSSSHERVPSSTMGQQ